MNTAIRLSKLARQDLIEITKYLAMNNPAASRRWLDDIWRFLNILKLHPDLGRSRDDLLQGLRCAMKGNFMIAYHVSEQSLDVVRILDARRDYSRLF